MSICAAGIANGFQHRVAAHAASGALRDLLEHHHLSYSPEPLSEGAVFGLSGALDLRVRIAATAVPAIDLDGRTPSLEIELCRHLGLAADWCATDDARAGWELLHAELGSGYPTLVRADVGALNYRDAHCHDTRHAIVVTSYDPEAGVVWVADQCFPDPQRCTLNALAAARRSDGWPRPTRHALLRMRPPSRLGDPRKAIAAGLTRTVRSMRDPSVCEHPNERAGLAAIDAIDATWPQLPEMTGSALGQTLAALRFRIRDGGTGGALYRSLHARFLHDAAALLGSPQLGQAALHCDDLADAWRALADALHDDDPYLAHRAAEPCVHRVRRLEHRHLEALEAHLGTD
ncbi:MAG: hypothetical protein QOK16_4054 [Solirubrobacteraceae bacterium]|nr:hypothetical protein [Solirubrobacteraceae bacterium]